MLWLLFCKPGPREMTAAERFAQSDEALGRPLRKQT